MTVKEEVVLENKWNRWKGNCKMVYLKRCDEVLSSLKKKRTPQKSILRTFLRKKKENLE